MKAWQGAAAAAATAAVLAVSAIALGAGVAAGATPPNGPAVTMHVECTTTGELCGPAFAVSFTATAGTVPVQLTSSSACAPIKIHVALDGKKAGVSGPLDFAGGSHGFLANDVVRLSNASGRHVVSFQAEGIHAGCDTGTIGSWEAVARFPSTVTVQTTSARAAAFVTGGAGSAPVVTMSDVKATFATLPRDANQFDAAAMQHPAFTRRFPTIAFNPSSEIQLGCSRPTGVSPETRPITDVVPHADGTCELLPAEGNGHRMGVGPDEAFEIAFVGTFTISRAGDANLSFFSDDGVVLGIGRGPGGQPSRVGGVLNNPPATTALRGFTVVGANNVITPPTEQDFKVHFPGKGTYPFELDYFEGAGGQLAVALTSGTTLLASGTVRSGFASSVRAPTELSTSVAHIVANLVVAATFGLLIAFPSELFDSTLAEHYDQVTGFFNRLLRPFRRGGAVAGLVPTGMIPEGAVFAAMLVISALLYGLLDPSFGFSRSSAILFAGLLAGLVIVTVLFNLPRLVMMRLRHGEWGRPQAFPAALPIAIGCVVLSRLGHFHPGYLYGAIAGLSFQSSITEDEEGRAIAASSVWILGLSIAAWLLRSPLRAEAEAPGASVLSQMADVALVTVFVAGLEGLLIGLLPMRFLEGERLRAWSKKVWYALFGAALLGFVAVLLNPTGSYLGHGSGPAVLTAALLFLLFGTVSVGFWAWFRYGPGSRPAHATGPRPGVANVPE